MENNEKRSKLQFLHFFYDFSIGYFKKIESLPLATAWNRIRLDNKSLWPRWKKEEVTNIHTAQTLFAKHNSPDSASFSCYFENDFPESIRQNKSLSPVLYYLGNIALFSGTSVCVVGSRNPSAFGIATTRNAVKSIVELSQATIVSGFARGIDIEAHKQALRSGGRTIAIIGSGLSNLYPREHLNYVTKFSGDRFLLSSPFPSHCPPLPKNFPRRNRLLTHLSVGTACVEGGPKSGSLITGKHSLDLGKTTCVFIQDYRSDFGRGCIELIRLGAEPVTDMEDMLEKLAFPLGGQLGLFPHSRKAIPSTRKATPPEKYEEFSIEEYAKKKCIAIPQAICEIQEQIESNTISRVPGRQTLFIKNSS